MMHHQGLTDLTGASFTPARFDQCRSDGDSGAGRFAVRDLKTCCRRSGRARESSRRPARRRAASGMCRWRECCRNRRSRRPSVVWVPSASNAAGLLDLVAGGVDLVAGSHPGGAFADRRGQGEEPRDARRAAVAALSDVPTGEEAHRAGRGRSACGAGIAAPKNLPKEIEARLQAAVKKAYESKEYQDFMTSAAFGCVGRAPDEFGDVHGGWTRRDGRGDDRGRRMLLGPRCRATAGGRPVMLILADAATRQAAATNDPAASRSLGSFWRSPSSGYARRFRRRRGSTIGPGLFPTVIGVRLRAVRARPAWRAAASAERRPAWLEFDDGCGGRAWSSMERS